MDKALYDEIKKTAAEIYGDLSDLAVLPGFCDVHVHFREPGFSYKETIHSGSLAAAHGGHTAVCTMPNLDPVPDSIQHLKVQTDIIARDAVISVYPYGAITKGEQGKELADMDDIANSVIAFSDDGKGVQDEGMMRAAMQKAKALGKIIAAHCEVDSLLCGGYIHDGVYAKAHGHKGICGKSEYAQIERDIKLADETKCKYHVCHISCRESVELIRDAKKSGVDITCETAPHYLILDENDLVEDGRFKMNPPLRSSADRAALIEGVESGVIDMIATDHAPHSVEEKSRGLKNSPFGIVGLEIAFPLLYTNLVRQNIISLNRLVELMATKPRERFGIEQSGFSIWDLNENFEVDSGKFLSKGRATPFEGKRLYGVNKLTFSGKDIVFNSVNHNHQYIKE